MLEKLKWLFNWSKYKRWNRIIIYYDKEWRVLPSTIEFTWDWKQDKKIIQKLWIQKIIKELNIKKLWEVMAKFKVTPQFLLHFFEIMEQQEEHVGWKVIFDIPRIFERLQTNDVEYFEFYKYVVIELNRWKKIWEIIRQIKWFENYIEFFDMLDWLKEADKSKIFWKLKEKILKEQSIKKQILWPLKQPIVLLSIILSIFVWFSWSMIKDILAQFVYLWYTDRTPWIIVFIYNFWHFISQNYLLIIYYILSIIIFVLWILQIKSIKMFINKLLFSIDFYKYFNELFIWYMILLQSNNEKKWLKDIFYDLKESYKDNIYYYFVFNLIYHKIITAAEQYIPLRKYWYVLSNEFISSLDQIIKQKKFILINWYLRFVDGKIEQSLKKNAAILSTLWTAIVAIWILILFLWIFLWNNAKSDLMKMQANGDYFQADVKFNLVDPVKMNNIIEYNKEKYN